MPSEWLIRSNLIKLIIIIINSTYKAQNLPKNSERTKNKKNTQELWIRKSLTEQMHFQMSLELQEISDVTKTAWKRVPNSRGSKMKWPFTGWLKVNPGNFEQFFRRWAKNTRRLINVQNRGQIWRKSTLEMTESQNGQFVLNTKFQRQPVKLSENGCNMLVLSLFSDETGWTVLNFLKKSYLIRSDTSQCWITKIKTWGNNRINKTSSRFFSQVRANGANTSQR